MGGVMQRLRETLVFMRVGVPVVRYLATFEGAKSRQKVVFSTLFCGFDAISFWICPFLPGFEGSGRTEYRKTHRIGRVHST
jgi:hypothetical protein